MASAHQNTFHDDLKLLRRRSPTKATAWIPREARQATYKFRAFLTLMRIRQIIEQDPIEQHGQLPNLTQELILEITDKLSWPDKVSLGLTCKVLARKTQFARQHFATVEERKKSARDAERAAGTAHNSVPAAQKKDKKSVPIAQKIARDAGKTLKAANKFVRLDLLRQIRGFFPAKRYRLCFGCIKYVPKTSGLLRWGGDTSYHDIKHSSKKAHDFGPRCTICVEREHQRLCAVNRMLARRQGRFGRP